MVKKYLAQNISIGGQDIQGPLQGINNIGDVVNRVMAFVIPLAAVILIFVLIWGGFDFMMSQGNPEKVKSGRAKITTGIVGFILLAVSYLVVRFISSVFGLGEGLF